MAQIVRKLQKIFALNAPSGEVGVIGSKAGGTPLTSKDLDILQADARLLLGYFSTTSDQGTTKLPYTQEQNAIDYILTTQLKYLFQNGIPEYLATEDYYPGISFTQDEGMVWRLKSDSASPTTGFKPSTNQDKWDPAISPLVRQEDDTTGTLDPGWVNIQETVDTTIGNVTRTFADGNFVGQKITIICAGSNFTYVKGTGIYIDASSLGVPISDNKKVVWEWDGSSWNTDDIVCADYTIGAYHIRQWTNGLMEMDGDNIKNNGATAVQVFTYPVPFATRASVLINSVDLVSRLSVVDPKSLISYSVRVAAIVDGSAQADIVTHSFYIRGDY